MAVLSIQSHVVAGHVGNSAAVFCMGRLGVDVWGLDTLQFSNHAGYPGHTGEVFLAGHIRDIISGLEKYVGLSECDAVLSGYVGKAETGMAVLDAVRKVKAVNPKAVYCCDPVMGDGGEVYVSAEIPDFMKHHAVPAADFIMPNHFELELLAGHPVNSVQEAVAAGRELLSGGQTRLIVVTSFRNKQEGAKELSVLSISSNEAHQVVTPEVFFDFSIAGTGDMLASVFLAYWLKSKNVPYALSMSVSAVYGVIQKTAAAKKREIQIISAQNELIQPSRVFSAVTI